MPVFFLILQPKSFKVMDTENNIKSIVEQLFTSLYNVLFIHCQKYVHDEEVSRDTIQDVFEKIWQDHKNLEFSNHFHSYMFNLATQKSLDHLRRLKIEKKILGSYDQYIEYEENNRNTILDDLIADCIQSQVDRVLEQLPAINADVFRKSRYDGMSNKEIAKALNISPRTVETYIYRTLIVLKKKLLQ